jgi:hypothetical protein
LTVKPKAQATPEPESTLTNTGQPSTKTKRRIHGKDKENLPPNTGGGSADMPAGSAAYNDQGSKDGGELERTASGSKEGSEADGGIGGKKKPKKKKRSVLANQSNPHHVDNCRLNDFWS